MARNSHLATLLLLSSALGWGGCSQTAPRPLVSSTPSATVRNVSATMAGPPITPTPSQSGTPVVTQDATPTAFDYKRYFLDTSYDLLVAEHNFGHVVQGEKPEHTFTLTNPTSFGMALGEIRSAIPCCVTATPGKMVLEAGESTPLVVKLDSAHQGGPLNVNIVIPVKEQEQPMIYRVTAEVEPVITTEPYALILQGPKKTTLTVKSARFATGLKITQAEADDPKIRVIGRPATSSEQVFDVDASAVAERPYGVIRFLTTDKAIPDMLVQYEVK